MKGKQDVKKVTNIDKSKLYMFICNGHHAYDTTSGLRVGVHQLCCDHFAAKQEAATQMDNEYAAALTAHTLYIPMIHYVH